MSDVIVAVIITGAVQIIVTWMNGRKLNAKLREVEKNTNSITERLGAAKFAEGAAFGKEEEKRRTKDDINK